MVFAVATAGCKCGSNNKELKESFETSVPRESIITEQQPGIKID